VEDLNRDPEFVSELKTKVNKNNETKTVKLKSSKNNTEIKVEDLDTSENDLENTHVAVKSVSRDKEPEIKILNEKRENTVQKVGGRKIHKVKLRQKVAQAVNETAKAVNETAKDKKTAPEMELYEVYFDKNSENPLSTKTKTNIQKIKFKRRSPSLSSF